VQLFWKNQVNTNQQWQEYSSPAQQMVLGNWQQKR
jgi:hypothetical protein